MSAPVVVRARFEWHKARPVSAMVILAQAGYDVMARRKVLRSWGVSADDAIDFAADSYIDWIEGEPAWVVENRERRAQRVAS